MDDKIFSLWRYRTRNGRVPVSEWIEALDAASAARILVYLERLRFGRAGGLRSVGRGVWELKIDVGPGYRVYFSQVGKRLLLLLCGGDKGSQRRDVRLAKRYREDYLERMT
ncbi:MAG: addiction module killer protein [Elusimicrobia bacterium CG_4_9_14_3_um_filter_62_55]|nr:MAG: addiction module killer protein [Elusimicrobia bacterium CG22_combo_CG10-13_8_21_14_all_63_91]PJA17886.1 MAG: addiction module killer protein [Elusimicrobia bacterium CG_4_10_14_0_2_um_filter_63_34]PJB26584.1 MAG: addiction module killer protein [Elusimicrobia bacterium CG_4_9_14_3_um_filter_62_55]